MGAVMNRLAFVGERKVMKPLYCMILVMQTVPCTI